MTSIDDLDNKILKLLEQDAWQSSKVLAKILNISEATLRRRLRRLIQRGIVHAVAITDSSTIPPYLSALIALNVAHEDINEITRELDGLPEITWFATTTGQFDIIILVQFPSMEELNQFIQTKLIAMKGIKDSETFICLHVYKGSHLFSID
ncbi:Lrp/AsnC family transcriptional regulator [Chloroflexota bacterium]